MFEKFVGITVDYGVFLVTYNVNNMMILQSSVFSFRLKAITNELCEIRYGDTGYYYKHTYTFYTKILFVKHNKNVYGAKR
jgi:hypothetical protein